jgi:hypothetical protein
MLSKSLETDIRAVENHLFGTGTYTMFQRIKKKLEELAQQTHNKQSAQLKCCHSCFEYGSACEHPVLDRRGCSKWVESF